MDCKVTSCFEIFFNVSFRLQCLLIKTNVGRIWPPNSLRDQLVVWYWPIGNNEHLELRLGWRQPLETDGP